MYKGNELNGIISYLTNKKEEENSDEEVLKLSGRGRPNPSHPITNLIKYDPRYINEWYYNDCNGPLPNQTEGLIEFDFGERKVNLTSYTLRTTVHESRSYHAKSWRIVGSIDGKEWDDIDSRTNDSSLNGPYMQHRFDCKHTNKYYRYRNLNIVFIFHELNFLDQYYYLRFLININKLTLNLLLESILLS